MPFLISNEHIFVLQWSFADWWSSQSKKIGSFAQKFCKREFKMKNKSDYSTIANSSKFNKKA